MTGIGLIVVFAVLIIVMIVMMSKFNVHAFLAMMVVSLALGLIAGIPLVNVVRDGVAVQGMTFVIASGFAATIQGIGLVIIFGAMIGMILEMTGAAFKLADMVIRVVGQKRPILGLELMGWIVSIPVFCDSGFVILDPVRKALVKKTKISSVSASIALSLGLYAAHVFIPPTPGPIAAANTLFEGAQLPVNLLLVMGIGVLASIPALIAAYFFAVYIGKRVKSREDLDSDTITQTYEEIKASYGKMPGNLSAVLPILVPILLIALGSIAGMQRWTGFGGELALFFGTPFIAIGCGVLFGVLQIKQVGKMDKFYEMCNNTLKVVGPIIFITATSGVLGLTIRATDIVVFIEQNVGTLTTIGIFLPFILAAILKTAQGSSTVALIITSGIVAPMLGILGLASPIGVALCVMSIAAGSMTVSHANDSYYWVVTNFGGMTPQQGYRVQTLGTLVQGTASIIGVFILQLILL